MTCQRCQSMMVSTVPLQFYSSGEDQSDGTFGPSYRCVCCGNYVDAVVLANRAKQVQAQRAILHASAVADWAEFNAPVRVAS